MVVKMKQLMEKELRSMKMEIALLLGKIAGESI
jgi:hypothetical protein